MANEKWHPRPLGLGHPLLLATVELSLLGAGVESGLLKELRELPES